MTQESNFFFTIHTNETQTLLWRKKRSVQAFFRFWGFGVAPDEEEEEEYYWWWCKMMATLGSEEDEWARSTPRLPEI